MMTTFHSTGVSAGTANCSYELRIATTIPERPSSTTIGKSTRERPTARSKSPPGSPNGRSSNGAASMKIAVSPPRPSSTSQKMVDATRQARARSPLTSSSLKTGTKAPERAASATRARTRLGIWKATVKALILPVTPKK